MEAFLAVITLDAFPLVPRHMALSVLGFLVGRPTLGDRTPTIIAQNPLEKKRKGQKASSSII